MYKCIDLKCENLVNPMGVDVCTPRFSWKFVSDKADTVQAEYEITVADMWHAKVSSDKSLYIKYEGLPLKPKTKYDYTVRVTNNHGEVSPLTHGSFTTGFMGVRPVACWIGQKNRPEKIASYVKKVNCEDFQTAYIFASAYGLYELYINGKRVGDSFFEPGFTSYDKRLQYKMYDVSEYLTRGENEIKIHLGKGWCCGRYPFQSNGKTYCDIPAFMIQMEVDGKIVLKSDKSWKYYDSPILFSEFYDGELYDSRMEKELENEGEIDIFDYSFDNLVWHSGSDVTVVREIKPIRMFKTPENETVIDFGQNMVGWAEFSGTGHSGDIISFTHAETLDSNGNFYTENLRTAKNEVTFILNGDKNQKYHPHFSFQGFRYIRIDKCTLDISLESFTGKVICSVNPTAKLNSSNEDLNRLFLNVLWGQMGNFVDIPTDCPQRDERVGWTGDAQVFMATALKNADCSAFFTKWLSDMKAEQFEDGLMPRFIPRVGDNKAATAWSDCACICPWELYKAAADQDFLLQMYPMMKNWVYYIKTQGDNPYLWNTGEHFGDWLGLDAQDGSYVGATDKYYIATAFFAYSTALTIKAAKALELTDDAKELSILLENIKKEFLNTYTDDVGMPIFKTQTAYALGLFMDLFENKKQAASELNELIVQNGTKLTTGFVGTPYLCYALSENGYLETAYDILLQDEYPSWLYSVKQGATTIWEHWDSIKPDGSMWSTNMNSFNHYAYGSIADWIYSVACGIQIDEDNNGYKHSVIAPKPCNKLTHCYSEFDTPYGTISSGWEFTKENKIKFTVKIPCNTTATILLPNGDKLNKNSGEYSFEIENM